MRISDWSSDVCSSDLQKKFCKAISILPSPIRSAGERRGLMKEMTLSERSGRGGSTSCDEEFFTVAEVAERLRCKPRTLLNSIHTGAFPPVRIYGSRPWLNPPGESFTFKDKIYIRAREL